MLEPLRKAVGWHLSSRDPSYDESITFLSDPFTKPYLLNIHMFYFGVEWSVNVVDELNSAEIIAENFNR